MPEHTVALNEFPLTQVAEFVQPEPYLTLPHHHITLSCSTTKHLSNTTLCNRGKYFATAGHKSRAHLAVWLPHTLWLISNAFTQMTNNKCYLTGRIHFSSVCQLWVGRKAPRNEMYEAWTSRTRGFVRHWRTDLLLSNVFNAAVSGDHRFNDVTTSSDNRISIDALEIFKKFLNRCLYLSLQSWEEASHCSKHRPAAESCSTLCWQRHHQTSDVGAAVT